MNNLTQYLPFIGVAIHLFYMFGMIFLISFVTKKVFSGLSEKKNNITVELLPYTCRLSNLVIVKTIVDFSLLTFLVLGVPLIILHLGLQRIAPNIMEFSLLELFVYLVGFLGFILLVMCCSWFWGSKPTIVITDNYIDFKWRCAGKNDFSGKMFYSSIQKLNIGRDSFVVETEEREITILYEMIICYKGYNKITEILKSRMQQ